MNGDVSPSAPFSTPAGDRGLHWAFVRPGELRTRLYQDELRRDLPGKEGKEAQRRERGAGGREINHI